MAGDDEYEHTKNKPEVGDQKSEKEFARKSASGCS